MDRRPRPLGGVIHVGEGFWRCTWYAVRYPVDLSFVGSMIAEFGESDLVRTVCVKAASHEVVVGS